MSDAEDSVDEAMRDALAEGDPEVVRILEASPRGVSMVIGPTGDTIEGVLSDSEGILYADIDLAECVEPKQFHDVVGCYNRFDIFKLTVNRTANRPITFEASTDRIDEHDLVDDPEWQKAPPATTE